VGGGREREGARKREENGVEEKSSLLFTLVALWDSEKRMQKAWASETDVVSRFSSTSALSLRLIATARAYFQNKKKVVERPKVIIAQSFRVTNEVCRREVGEAVRAPSSRLAFPHSEDRILLFFLALIIIDMLDFDQGNWVRVSGRPLGISVIMSN
jgi:hypothetical protein